MNENKMVVMLVEESLLNHGYRVRQIDHLLSHIKAGAWDEGAEHAAMRPDLSANPYRTVKDN